MSKLPVTRITSGGQTGVDRAALDVAIFLELEHGGWCPRNRQAEDGTIPDIYLLKETAESDYAIRTEKNVIDSQGTLILYYSELSGGTKLTRQLAAKHRRPCTAVDLAEPILPSVIHQWLHDNRIETLNVAGPRESSCPGIGRLAERFLLQVFASS